ncbi:hypothetical protein ACS0TY_035289 [Phlomoides rotata]
MTHIPQFIVIKPVICKTYVCYESGTESHHLYCKGKSVFDEHTKIKLEKAKNSTVYYHLRFSHSNTYWAKCGDDKWIVAVSKKPNENISDSSCTLFSPTIDEKGVLRLTHVKSGKRVQTDSSSSRVYVDEDEDEDDDNGDGEKNSDSYCFTYLDWEVLVKIPKRVAFRGDNGKILKAVTYGNLNYLQFASTDGNDGYSAQEVVLQPDGHLRIKSVYYGKFWRLSPGWIWGDSSDHSGDNVDTLFWPVKVDSQTIALRSCGNNKFCKRLTADDKTDCLDACVSEITNEAKLIVEELVLQSDVYNVKYHMKDARVFEEAPYLAAVGVADNRSDETSTFSIKVVYEVTESTTFTHSYSLKLGTKTTFKAGVPCIVEGKIEASAEFTGTLAWGSTTAVKKGAEATLSVKVPAKSRAKVNYVGTHGKCSVPFSYTQKDKSSEDGNFVTTHHNDGIFYGINYYSFRFGQPAVEPL